ncbi:MAG: SDR family oxidoreductase [Polyangiaceae bacterium]
MSTSPTATTPPWALVTGASSGIGAEFARQLADRGWNSVLVARRKDRLEGVAAEVAAKGRTSHVVELDLLRPDAIDTLVAAIETLGVDVSLVVNNAGFGLHGETMNLDRGRILRMIDLNVRAMTDVAITFVARLVARGGGKMLNVASTASFQPVPHFAAYAATKAYVTSFSVALDREVAPKGVRILALCPGPTRTEFVETAELEIAAPSFVFMDVRRCVAIGLRALDRGRALVVTGWLNAIGAWIMHVSPLWFSTRIAGLLFAKR